MLDALTVQNDPTLKEKEKTMAINSNAITVEANKPARFNAQPPSKDKPFQHILDFWWIQNSERKAHSQPSSPKNRTSQATRARFKIKPILNSDLSTRYLRVGVPQMVRKFHSECSCPRLHDCKQFFSHIFSWKG